MHSVVLYICDTDLILSHWSICVVKPPHNITVPITMTRVVDNMRLRWSVDVLRIANANAMAPRKPENQNHV